MCKEQEQRQAIEARNTVAQEAQVEAQREVERMRALNQEMTQVPRRARI